MVWGVALLLCRLPLEDSSHARQPVLVCISQTATQGLPMRKAHSVSVPCAVQAAAQGLPAAPAAGQHGAGSCCLWQVQHSQGVLGGCRGVGRAPALVRAARGLRCPARLQQPAARHQGGLWMCGQAAASAGTLAPSQVFTALQG